MTTYAKAATNAVHGAGFDGVEIDGASVYLVDQFLRTVSNTRKDRWGGDEEGRTRFAREIVDAVVDAVGEDRVAIRISPWNQFQEMKMPDPRLTFTYLVRALRDKHPRMTYRHVIKPRVGAEEFIENEDENNEFLRWNGSKGGEQRIFISAGGYTREMAILTAEDKGGLITFGRLYISNPDLPVRLWKNMPLTPGDRAMYYLPGNLTPQGYNDWPFAYGSVPELEGTLN